MTLPASGAITLANFNTEVGNAAGTPIDIGWIYANAKTGQKSYSLGGYYSKAWYQRNMDGNCNNANCTTANTNCTTGDFQCLNCYKVAINCANCDTRAWLQSNCNCACTYNCTQAQWLYNCNCNCACSTDSSS